MKHILIIDGPNLNLLGRREPEIYGSQTNDDMIAAVTAILPTGVDVIYMQSNHEGEIIDALHRHGFDPEVLGIVLNAGAYTHTSLAIADAIAAIAAPVIEVHISNVHARESVRHTSMLAGVCRGVIAGFGLDSYVLGATALLRAAHCL